MPKTENDDVAEAMKAALARSHDLRRQQRTGTDGHQKPIVEAQRAGYAIADVTR